MQDRMLQRTDEFKRALLLVEGIEIINYDEEILFDRRALNAGKLLKNALYVRDSNDGLGLTEYSEFEFEPDPARLQGATDSHHGVIFGKLHTYDDDLPIAVKPFDDGRAAAIREHTAHEFMRSKGFESFRTLGIIACNNRVFLLTEDEPSLKTFDNLRWSPIALQTGDMGSEQLELITQTAQQLGRMHALGITHGDAQPRNVALSERGRVGFIDFESLLYDPRRINSEMMTRKMLDDLLSFYGKLHKYFGYCKDEDLKTRFYNFEEQFLDPYKNAYIAENTSLDERSVRRLMVGLKVDLIKYILTE